MDYWWKENRKYTLAVCGGLLLVILWAWFPLSSINKSADQARRDLSMARSQHVSRLASGVPGDETAGRAERDRKALHDELKSLQQATEFKIDDAFKKGNRSYQEALGYVRGQINKDLDAKCRERGFSQIAQGFGMPSSLQNVDERVAPEWLNRLAMIKRIAFVLVGTEFAERLEFLETVPSANQDEPLLLDKRFLNKLSMRIRIHTSSEALLRILHSLQQRGAYLAIEAFTMNPDPNRDLIISELTVSGLFVNPGEEIAPELGKDR